MIIVAIEFIFSYFPIHSIDQSTQADAIVWLCR